MNEKTIAFYSPLKPISHPTPSGDRLMARLLVDCLKQAGFNVDVASLLRAFLPDPNSSSHKASLVEQAELETERLANLWAQHGAPQLWFCYHPYYKSPDLIGPPLCKRFNIPYVTAEASYSTRRREGIWAAIQESVRQSIDSAAVNICFTERDKTGLQKATNGAKLARMRPFINTTLYESNASSRDGSHLVTVAMMRAGDKLQSYAKLAKALERLQHLPWSLSIVGDGPLREEVHSLFSEIPTHRLQWHGQLEPQEIASLFTQSGLYVWPGCGEAYGLAYLEAQAAGLPVVAYATAGVPEVVASGRTGLLTSADDDAYANAIASLLTNPNQLNDLSIGAASQVKQYHSLQAAGEALLAILQKHVAL